MTCTLEDFVDLQSKTHGEEQILKENVRREKERQRHVVEGTRGCSVA